MILYELLGFFQVQYELPLKIISYEELYNWSMDSIVKQIGLKSNCRFCGVFRRQDLDRGGVLMKADKICTGGCKLVFMFEFEVSRMLGYLVIYL